METRLVDFSLFRGTEALTSPLDFAGMLSFLHTGMSTKYPHCSQVSRSNTSLDNGTMGLAVLPIRSTWYLSSTSLESRQMCCCNGGKMSPKSRANLPDELKTDESVLFRMRASRDHQNPGHLIAKQRPADILRIMQSMLDVLSTNQANTSAW